MKFRLSAVPVTMNLILLSGTLLNSGCHSAEPSEKSAMSGNPVFPGWYADPEGAVFGKQFWIYPTYSAPYEQQVFMDAFSSPDFVNWTKHSRIIDTDAIAWARRAMWAPAIVEKNNRYFLFFAANDIQKDDFTGFEPFPDGAVFKEITPRGYVEGPFMFVRDGKYYFMWSEGGWTGPDYSVAYAIADSPLGPFERIGKILQQDPNVATGAGHHSVIQVPGKEKYYIVYHRRPLGETDGNHRVVCIDRMEFDEEGFIRPVKITFEGVPPVKL